MSLVVLGCVIFLAILGHGYLWMDGVNRLHAWAGPRFLIDYPTYAAVVAFAVLPLLVAWDWWQLGSGYNNYYHGYGDYSYHDARASAAYRSRAKAEATAESKNIRVEGFSQIDDATGDIRRKMTRKYKVEF